jgi:hypothetical protein
MLPLALTQRHPNALEYFKSIIECEHLMSNIAHINVSDVSLKKIFGDMLLPEWHSVWLAYRGKNLFSFRIFFSKLEADQELSHGCGQTNAFFYADELEKPDMKERLLKCYRDSRKTQYAYCIAVGGFDEKTCFTDAEKIVSKWLCALKAKKVDDWEYKFFNRRDNKFYTVIGGSWRQRKIALETFCKIVGETKTLFCEIATERKALFWHNLSSVDQRHATPNRIYIQECGFEKPLRYPQREFTWRVLHDKARALIMALEPLALPPYVMLEVLDKLAEFWVIERILKVRLIEALRVSTRRIYANRLQSMQE